MDHVNDSKLTRREALATIGVAVAACGVARAAEEKAVMKTGIKPNIALQLYTMREPAKADLPGTLKKCREMGWEYVQWSGMPDLPADKIREALDTAGLKAIAAHCGVEPFEKDFDGQVAFWKKVGVTYVGPGGMMGDCRDSLEAWLRGAKRLDALGAKLRGVGMHLTFHNHTGEFEKFSGDPRPKEDILLEATNPKNVFAEFDLAWVKAAGADPAAYIRKYKGRCPTVHAKDLATEPKEGKHPPFAALGKGILNWTDIFAAGRESGIEWYIYEQDTCASGPFVDAKTSYDFLAKSLL